MARKTVRRGRMVLYLTPGKGVVAVIPYRATFPALDGADISGEQILLSVLHIHEVDDHEGEKGEQA